MSQGVFRNDGGEILRAKSPTPRVQRGELRLAAQALARRQRVSQVISGNQLLATLSTSTAEDTTTGFGSHASTETVGAFAAQFAGLIGSLHDSNARLSSGGRKKGRQG